MCQVWRRTERSGRTCTEVGQGCWGRGAAALATWNAPLKFACGDRACQLHRKATVCQKVISALCGERPDRSVPQAFLECLQHWRWSRWWGLVVNDQLRGLKSQQTLRRCVGEAEKNKSGGRRIYSVKGGSSFWGSGGLDTVSQQRRHWRLRNFEGGAGRR